MFLDYGLVRLKIIDLTRFERETVWSDDGTDLLYIRNSLGVTATYAPGGYPSLDSLTGLTNATRDTLNGNDRTFSNLRSRPRGDAPTYTKPDLETGQDRGGPYPTNLLHTGPQTDAELRAHLWLPRQKLILWAYARDTGVPIRWLESPRPGFGVDVNNGPKPLSVDVVAAHGEPSSVAVHWQVQTDTSPCPSGADRLVLSHRWEMSHGHDENFYLTRTITGVIVFNRAVASAQNIRPDFVRAQFIHPIPLGFRRNVPVITQSSDGNSIKYVVTDTDPTIVFDPGDSGASQMQIVERMQSSVERGFA